MKLTEEGLKNKEEWLKKGYFLPKFDRKAVEAATKKSPFWVHFGAGNIFRAFQANVAQNLLNDSVIECGLVVAEGYDYEIIEKMYRPHDNIGVLVTLKSNGSVEKTVVASIMESLTADSDNEKDWARLCEIFRNPSLQIVSFTITEKGYLLRNAAGVSMPGIEEDFAMGPVLPKSYIGKVVTLLHERFVNGELPVAMVSMDNCSHNGDKLYAAVNEFAQEWETRGVCKPGFLDYVNDESKVSFPWTMIDKITPRPDAKIEKILRGDGIEQLEPIITSKKTYVAPFVNAEECQYLVIEDKFPNGRPELERAGLYFTDRETVDKVEKMKVCTCLNPLHTFLAISGCLLGYTLISDEMKDADLLRLVKRLGYEEGLPVVVDPKIIKPRDFIDEVVNIRIPNPFMPDTPQRIACDSSQKLSIRFGETIKGYLARKDLSIENLKVVPLVFALWLRYLMAIDDDGNEFELSPDPLLSDVQKYVANVKLGEKFDVHTAVGQLLKRSEIFGVDLYKVGLGSVVEKYFEALCQGNGAVRNVIQGI